MWAVIVNAVTLPLAEPEKLGVVAADAEDTHNPAERQARTQLSAPNRVNIVARSG
jgi:hypothetical protein